MSISRPGDVGHANPWPVQNVTTIQFNTSDTPTSPDSVFGPGITQPVSKGAPIFSVQGVDDVEDRRVAELGMLMSAAPYARTVVNGLPIPSSLKGRLRTDASKLMMLNNLVKVHGFYAGGINDQPNQGGSGLVAAAVAGAVPVTNTSNHRIKVGDAVYVALPNPRDKNSGKLTHARNFVGNSVGGIPQNDGRFLILGPAEATLGHEKTLHELVQAVEVDSQFPELMEWISGKSDAPSKFDISHCDQINNAACLVDNMILLMDKTLEFLDARKKSLYGANGNRSMTLANLLKDGDLRRDFVAQVLLGPMETSAVYNDLSAAENSTQQNKRLLQSLVASNHRTPLQMIATLALSHHSKIQKRMVGRALENANPGADFLMLIQTHS